MNYTERDSSKYINKLSDDELKFLDRITAVTMSLIRHPDKENVKISPSEFSGYKSRIVDNIILLEKNVKK